MSWVRFFCLLLFPFLLRLVPYYSKFLKKRPLYIHHSIFLGTKASGFLVPTIIPVFSCLLSEQFCCPTPTASKSSNSLYFLLLLPRCETLKLIIFLALYHPFTDENDGAFVTAEGSESHLVVMVCDWKWSWNTKVRALCLAGLEEFLIILSPVQT